MDLDNLQEWIQDLYHRIEEHKECVEYQAHLLDELVRPWPFNCTPQSTQDAYKRKLEQERDQEAENDKISKFDKEIQSVENILQKARLLHEKETSIKTIQVVENGVKVSEPRTTKNKTSANKKVSLKALPDSASSRAEPKRSLTLAQKGQITRIRKAPYKTSPHPFSGKPTRPRIRSTGTEVQKQKPVKLKPSIASSIKKTDVLPKITENEGTTEQNNENSTKLANTSPTQPASTKLKETKNIDIDVSKLDDIKLCYSEFASELEIPIKVKKLLTTHSKLCDEVGNIFENKDCEEKINFMKNLTLSCPSDHSEKKPIKTLKAVNTQLVQCIRICTNVISVLKYQNEIQLHGRSSKLRWSSQQDMYLKSETLKVVEGICSQLWRNYKFYKSAGIVDCNVTERLDFDIGLLSWLRLDDFSGIYDDLPYPASSLTYSSLKEVVKYTCEKLKHQCFLIGWNLLQNLSKTYICSLEKMISTEKGSSLSQELVSLLQNSYGLLAEEDILLPAYVKAE